MRNQTVPYVNLAAQWKEERDELLRLIDQELLLGKWVGGESVELFEAAVASACSSRHAVALNSGTDSLTLALSVLGVRPGDEVITTPNSFIATTACIAHLGAVPVFVDVLDDQTMDPGQLEAALSRRTRAILPVHLTGRMCQMDRIVSFAEEHDLIVVEDSAQSIGSSYRGRSSGTWGDIGCFSTHPLKNLNAIGDGGFIVTDSLEAASRVRNLRSHGLIDRNSATEFGFVSRMDSLQAVVLRYRLAHLQRVTEARRNNARQYHTSLEGLPLALPPMSEDQFDTFHTFVIQTDQRDALKSFLSERGIGSAIHYPVLIPDQPAMLSRSHRVVGDLINARKQVHRILSLPIHQNLSEDDIESVVDAIRAFFSRQ